MFTALELIIALGLGYFLRAPFESWLRWDYSLMRDGLTYKLGIDFLIWALCVGLGLGLAIVKELVRVFRKNNAG